MNYSSLIFASIASLIQYYSNTYKQEDLQNFIPKVPVNYSIPSLHRYDFIIVGGGTAGCVLASRLSENPKLRILLLELGGTPPPHLEVPAFMKQFLPLEEVSFQYRSVKQNYSCKAFNNGKVLIRAGKVLGGTSSINGMFFNRGHPLDYDNWANLTGDTSWRYINLMKYFKRIETYEGSFQKSEFHGAHGRIPISKPTFAPGLEHWINAGDELGIKRYDPNGPHQIGLSGIEFTKRNGRRVSSYDAYLKDVETERPNLEIIKYAQVNEILFDDSTNEAVGVKYEKFGFTKFALCSKEVILSAGTYGTPRILLNSGIGGIEELEKLNVQQKLNLPGVGKNLMEHPLVPLRIIINDTNAVYVENRDLTPSSVKEYLENGTGPLSSDKSVVGQGFFVSNQAIQEGFPGWPDIQFSLYSQDFSQLPVPKPKDLSEFETSIFILPYLGRPKSRGNVEYEISSSTPFVDFKLLSHAVDRLTYIQGINKSLEIFETTNTYKNIGARYSLEPVPECNSHTFRSNEYWECYILQYAFIGNHPVGTCKMGRGQEDPSAVVDSKLKVLGLKGLRIVDASVMPVIPNSNTQAAVYMIAEKASEEILLDWDSEIEMTHENCLVENKH